MYKREVMMKVEPSSSGLGYEFIDIFSLLIMIMCGLTMILELIDQRPLLHTLFKE
jgi:hypothetical protein